jgi:putative membrane protein
MSRDEQWLVITWLGRRLFPWFLAITLYCVVVAAIVKAMPRWHVDWGTEAALANGVILGVLMGLRNRSAYDRWWEARRLWGQLINDSRNLAWKIRSYLPRQEIHMSRIPELLTGFADALRDHLRGGAKLQDIPGFEDETQQPAHVPSYLAGRIISRIAHWQRKNLIDARTMQVFDVHSRALLEICGGCERIRNTPMSISYRTLLRLGLALNILAAPWYIMLELGLWSIPVLIVVCFFLVGVEAIDAAVEEPFGTALDDLPLSAYCNTVRDSIEEVLFADQLPEDAELAATLG